jgi:hypothetical protein
MTQPQARPEDRCRSGIDSPHEQPWADTHPGCFRSEGFAEDLPDAAPHCTIAATPRTSRLAPARAPRHDRPHCPPG